MAGRILGGKYDPRPAAGRAAGPGVDAAEIMRQARQKHGRGEG
jgi:hypothetical protein